MGLIVFILAMLLMLSGVIAFVGGIAVKEGAVVGIGAVLLVLGGLFLIMDSSTTVAPRGVAVQTAFGKVRGDTLGSGWHWVAPWNAVEEFDASVQTLKFYHDEPNDDGECITVRLGNNNTACVDVTTQWNIDHAGDVKALYLQYKTFTNIHDNLVKRQLGSALNEVFGTYDPLASVDANGTPTLNTKTLQDKVRISLQRDIGTGINIDSVTIPIVHFDNATEDRLRAFQQAKADTRIAEQQKLTADQQALANQNLAKGAAALNDPGVAYQNCLNLVDRLAKENQLQNLPPTFNCNGSSSGNTLLQLK